MKKLIFILFVLVSFTSFGQVYQKMPQFGYGPVQRMDIETFFTFPTVCGTSKLDSIRINGVKKKAAIAYDSCNAKFYVFNPKDSSWSTLNDSTTFVPYNEYGIKSGGEVRRLTGNNYEITTVYYTIEGVNYRALTDTVTLNSYADSAQVAGIFANTAQVISVRYSAKSSQPVFPPPVPTEEVLVAYVLISDTGNVIYTPSVDSNWVRDGDNLLNANPGNVILNDIYFIDGGVQKRIFVANNQLWLQSNRTTGSKILLGTVGGNISVSTNEVEISGGDNSGTSGTKSALIISGRLLNASGTEAYNFISSSPTINKTGGTGDISFIKYNPTLTSVTGEHYFLNSSAGRVKLGGLGTSIDTTTYKPLGINSSGDVRKLSFWPTGSGGGGGGTPTLDQVTTAGNTTNNSATFGDLTGSTLSASTSLDVGTSASIGTSLSAQSADIDWRVSTDTLLLGGGQLDWNDSYLSVRSSSGNISLINPDAGTAQLDAIDITGTKNFKFQDKSGTLAFLSDITDSTKNFYVYSPLVVRDTTDGYVVEIDPDSLAAWRPKYKVYTALLSQSGTSAPTAIVLENTLGATPTFSYNAQGGYTVTCTGCFTEDKTVVSTGYTDYKNSLVAIYYYLDDSDISIQTFDISALPSLTAANDVLTPSIYSITIKVYY